jgi:hypothetical protein
MNDEEIDKLAKAIARELAPLIRTYPQYPVYPGQVYPNTPYPWQGPVWYCDTNTESMA